MTRPSPPIDPEPRTAGRPARGAAFAGAPSGTWAVGGRELALDPPVVMGVVNLTPDSFSDGGRFPTLDAALEGARALLDEGADMLDVGGESTRPGAEEIPPEEELERVLPFVREAARRFDVPISVDTRKSAVARAVLDAGASVINDVSGLHYDRELAAVVADRGAGLVLMHMRGAPATMGSLTQYERVTEDVFRELQTSIHVAISAGVRPEAIALDPGLGFAKTASQSLELLRDLELFGQAGLPILIGPSRKSFLGAVLGLPAERRLEGTLAACVAGYLAGARIFRVHDVAPVARALSVAYSIVHPEVVA